MHTDEELMTQFQAGIIKAFDTLVSRHTEYLFKFTNSRLRNEDASQDVVQEVFIRIYRNRHSYHYKTAKFSTWMYTIAKNLIITEYRRISKKSFKSIDTIDDPIDTRLIPPDVELHCKMQGNFINEALNSIKDSCREMIVLRDIQGLKYDEIAEITGAPLGSVKSEIFRARRKLRKLLKEIR